MKNIDKCKEGETDSRMNDHNQSENLMVSRLVVGKQWLHSMHRTAVAALFVLSGFVLCSCGGGECQSGSVSTCSEDAGLSCEDEDEYYEDEEYDEDYEEYDEDYEEEEVQKKAPARKSVKRNVVKKNDPSYDAGMQAYNAGEGLEAIRLFKASGSAQATYMLGVIYEVGCGNVGSNPMMARKFYKKAASMGCEEAQDKL